METKTNYQVAIIGGGVGGLTLAIQLASSGISTVLFEKNKFPFHKVCGEYVSMESWNFLERIGLNLSSLGLPKINRLLVSSPSGKILKQNLDLGGFGISRFMLDNKLSELAISNGVDVIEECKVENIEMKEGIFFLSTLKQNFKAEIVVGAWGKKSNLDVKLKRKFILNSKRERNYIGVKYHIKIDFPDDIIELHNFKNGYCGISKVENDTCCLCYLTDSENFKKCDGNMETMEREILFQNPYLKKYFSNSSFIFPKPITISQITLGYKNAIENNVILLGDAVGSIAPLCGNGMSMAMRSSLELNKLIVLFFKGEMNRKELEKFYTSFWRKEFKNRVEISITLQQFLKNSGITNFVIQVLKLFPMLSKKIIRATHGKSF